MAVRLRLTRMGRKKKPFYRIVAIDQRKRRDGKYLENLGYYNPVVEPTEVSLNEDRALYWLSVGAQPSDTVRSLLSKSGLLLRWDLMKRGKSDEEIDTEYKKWLSLQDDRKKKQEAGKIQKQKEVAEAKAKEEAEAKAKEEAEAKAKEEAEAKAKEEAEVKAKKEAEAKVKEEAVQDEAAPSEEQESGDEGEAAAEKE